MPAVGSVSHLRTPFSLQSYASLFCPGGSRLIKVGRAIILHTYKSQIPAPAIYSLRKARYAFLCQYPMKTSKAGEGAVAR